MSESKMADEEEYLRSLPLVDVTAVDISPNPAALTDEINLEVDFTLDKPVANGVWDIEYLVDSVTKRHIINILPYAHHESIYLHVSACGGRNVSMLPCVVLLNRSRWLGFDRSFGKQLGQVEATDYAKGDNHFQFTATEINIAGIEPSQFTNCGLLIASFKSREGEIMDLKMVIQVTEQRGALQRIIYNPLE